MKLEFRPGQLVLATRVWLLKPDDTEENNSYYEPLLHDNTTAVCLYVKLEPKKEFSHDAYYVLLFEDKLVSAYPREVIAYEQ